jgi:PAS domain S-box-containing protein
MGLQRGISRIALVGTGVLLLLFGVAAFWFAVAASNAARLEVIRKEELESADLTLAMEDQNKGVHLYVDSGDPAFLEPYRRGRRITDDALSQLGAQTAGGPRAAAVARVDAQARAWQRLAEVVRVRAAAAGGGPIVLDDPTAAQIIQVDDAFRTGANALEAAFKTDAVAATAGTQQSLSLGVASVLGIASLVALVLVFLARRVTGYALVPLQQLARAAASIARGDDAQIPDTGRSDEIGELARALQNWRDAADAREILVEAAPVGIGRVLRGGEILGANPALHTMLGYTGSELVGRSYLDLVHAADRREGDADLAALVGGRSDRWEVESRFLRSDGTLMWCSAIGALQRGRLGKPDSFIVIQEDVTERKREAERAASIQRRLLPTTDLQIDGYELAGVCRPAEGDAGVAGDFYDWVMSDGRYVDVAVADVMGKGVGAALVMAALRTALRAAPMELSPASRVRFAAESLAGALGLTDDGLFVTLFWGRLDLRSGTLRYVDGGHGYCAVRRPNGELLHLSERSLPIGIEAGGTFLEGTIRLQPGDSLIVYSDGLVETDERTGDLGDFVTELAGPPGAHEMVNRMMDRMPPRPTDDVTVVVLWRVPASAASPEPAPRL